tara:strand:- start:86 stop:262 length:177 start_codon:yes stop_codon:yes gene_type:complete
MHHLIDIDRSGHEIRIYELRMKFNSAGEQVIFVDDFKSALGISYNKYYITFHYAQCGG